MAEANTDCGKINKKIFVFNDHQPGKHLAFRLCFLWWYLSILELVTITSVSRTRNMHHQLNFYHMLCWVRSWRVFSRFLPVHFSWIPFSYGMRYVSKRLSVTLWFLLALTAKSDRRGALTPLGILNVSLLILFLSMMLQNTQAYVRPSWRITCSLLMLLLQFCF